MLSTRFIDLAVRARVDAGRRHSSRPDGTRGARRDRPRRHRGATGTDGVSGRAALAAVLLVIGGCGNDGSGPRWGEAQRVGPQGAVGQFIVECELSHSALDDPMVHPGEPGASHLHLFFGNRDVSASSTYETLRGGDTSCDQRRDTSSYWVPAVLDAAGRPIDPIGAVAYYRAGPGIDPRTVQPYPPGLKMLGGDPNTTSEQSLSITGWSCGARRPRSTQPPHCPDASKLTLNVTFPDCWNGTDVDTADHRSHTARSRDGACPDSHPVPIPELMLVVDFPPLDPDRINLASGGVLSGHAEFWNVWDQEKLEAEVKSCLHRDVVCGVTRS
jgi:hypothetical protein